MTTPTTAGGPVPETLAIHVGDAFELDARLWRATAERRLVIGGTQAPARAVRSEVLLLARAEAKAGAVFLVVGVLRGARLDGREITFDSLSRFIVPIVAGSDAAGHVRHELVGNKAGWSPSEFLYGPAAAVEIAVTEADGLLAPPRRT
jgi:hypothetical protein